MMPLCGKRKTAPCLEILMPHAPLKQRSVSKAEMNAHFKIKAGMI
jgi:hypothetical protein